MAHLATLLLTALPRKFPVLFPLLSPESTTRDAYTVFKHTTHVRIAAEFMQRVLCSGILP